jgi:rhamnogalacturonan endolyase
MKNIRAGKYTLYVVAENVMEEFRLDNVQIEANKTLDLGKISFQPSNSATTLWQIGTADRTTKGFGFSERNRNYQTFTQTPENLDFYIGKSKTKDWCYAQTKNGSWNIHFDLPDSLKNNQGEYVLTVGVAGASRNASLEVLINGNLIGKEHLETMQVFIVQRF